MALKKAAGKTTEAFHMAPPAQAPAPFVPAEFKPQQPQNLGFQPQAMDQFNPQQPMFNQGFQGMPQNPMGAQPNLNKPGMNQFPEMGQFNQMNFNGMPGFNQFPAMNNMQGMDFMNQPGMNQVGAKGMNMPQNFDMNNMDQMMAQMNKNMGNMNMNQDFKNQKFDQFPQQNQNWDQQQNFDNKKGAYNNKTNYNDYNQYDNQYENQQPEEPQQIYGYDPNNTEYNNMGGNKDAMYQDWEGVEGGYEEYKNEDANTDYNNQAKPKGKKGKKKGGANAAEQQPKKEKAPKKIVEKAKKMEAVVDVSEIKETKTNILDKNKDPMNIIIIGHVDSGKSTICGNILIKTGKIDQEEIRKYEIEAKQNDRESWMFAYVMDINEEEKAKGKTVEVGKASFDLATKRYIILDCPGHRNYVPNMISGAAQADVAALVVSAKSGEFEAGFERGGQTMEHTILARYLGSQFLLIIVNKMDECNWAKERFDYIQKNLIPFLRDTCGWDVEKQVKWVPVAGLMGLNIDEKVDSKICPWYEGDCLLNELDSIPKIKRADINALRIPVFDKFKDKGEVMLYGKITSGAIKENYQAVIMPKGIDVTITKIYNNDDDQIALAESGDNIKIQVKGVADMDDIRRGNMICGVQFKCFVCYEFLAEIKVLELPDKKKIISDAFPAIMHMHCIQEEVEIKKVNKNLDNVQKKGKVFLQSGSRGEVVIRSFVPICIEKFDEFPE